VVSFKVKFSSNFYQSGNLTMQQTIKQNISDPIDVKQKILNDQNIIDMIHQIVKQCVVCYSNNGKTLVCGNGGSAADAQNIAGELVDRFYLNRPALPSIALTTHSSVMTTISNDYGYDQIFARQVETHGHPRDVLFLISTSGRSPSILIAAKFAKDKKSYTYGFTGGASSLLQEICDINIAMLSKDTPRIQESHLLLAYIICSCIEDRLFSK
jgi:D-sedoheptulose 7-phosphate isomerase